ncbi:sperm flagellar protein 1-like isoform X2 [Ruditapes philippinarum]|uniref:sperm flagellar protein 1-like isoform X2 n=1 Tax=Ruditapes philippinarum TaxID=129788 RepID=UPI00295B1BA9|nr:sperm flagellar protein 1-like isoform X2 [Ruditapes philippinarum]
MTSKTKGGKTSTPSEHDKMEEKLDEQELESLYAWVDSIPLSRPKRNISRDFSDGVLVAEIMHHFFPKMVEMHNYCPANSTGTKQCNWDLLNRKVFSKMNFELADDVINDLCLCKPGMIEKVLLMLQVKIKRAEYARARNSDKPEADQHHHHHDQMTPGRKGMVKVGLEDTKGSRFQKTKQDMERLTITKSRLDLNAPLKRIKVDDYGHVITHRYLDNRGWNSGLHEQKAPPKPAIKQQTIQKKRPGQVVESDMVPRYVVEEKEQEVLSRDETIQILQGKIHRLEHLVHLKDMRITELSGGVEPNSYTHLHVHQRPAAQGHGQKAAAQSHGHMVAAQAHVAQLSSHGQPNGFDTKIFYKPSQGHQKGKRQSSNYS